MTFRSIRHIVGSDFISSASAGFCARAAAQAIKLVARDGASLIPPANPLHHTAGQSQARRDLLHCGFASIPQPFALAGVRPFAQVKGIRTNLVSYL
jgi:hypothetical protein